MKSKGLSWGLVGALVILTCWQVKPALGAEVPGITVLVVDDNNRPAYETNIVVRDQRGNVVLRGIVRNGVYEIADLGFGPHSITVGRGGCGEVELKNIRFYMDSHPTFRIILNSCPHSGASGGSGCFIAFRARDSEGPITGAVITAKGRTGREITDTYGRAVAIIAAGGSELFTAEAADHRSSQFDLECEFSGWIEKEVVLSRSER